MVDNPYYVQSSQNTQSDIVQATKNPYYETNESSTNYHASNSTNQLEFDASRSNGNEDSKHLEENLLKIDASETQGVDSGTKYPAAIDQILILFRFLSIDISIISNMYSH